MVGTGTTIRREVSAAASKSEQSLVTIKPKQSSLSSPLVNFPQTQQQSQRA
jgi:hypothetical protein